MSGKGGVGKTTIALNIAISLSKDFRRKVTLIDVNLDAPHLTILLRPRSKRNLSHYKVGFLSRVLERHRYGFYFLPASLKESCYEKIPLVIQEAKKLSEITILDTPPGFSREMEYILSSTDEVIPIVTPDPISVLDAARLIKKAGEFGKEIPGIILNRVEGKAYEVSKAKIYRTLKKEIIGVIPEDPMVKEALSRGKPLLYYNYKSPAARELRRITGKLLGFEWNPPGESFIERIVKIFRR